MELEEGSLVLCTVEKIKKAIVFVRIEGDGVGTIITSEVSPGRIRNLRDYVVPGKKIVCKVLKVENGNIHLSLRRVTAKERKEVLDRYEKERSSLNILKSVLKEKSGEVVEQIKKEQGNLYDFLQNCKEDPKLLEKYLPKEDVQKICKILKEKKEKQVEIKKEFVLKSDLPDGITKLKELLLPYKEQVNYLAAGKFILKVKDENYKKGNAKISEILKNI